MRYFFFQAEDGIRDLVRSRGLGDVYKRQDLDDAKAGILVAAMNVALDGAAFPPNASTLVGVTRLGMSGMLVEVSAVALLD